MKTIILSAIIGAVFFSGCSSAYKAARTPDDVYYSPARDMKAASSDRYESYASTNEDRYLQMKVRNRYQWGAIDDYSYWHDSRYDFGYNYFPLRQGLLNPYYNLGLNPYYNLGFGYGYFGLGFNYYYQPWYSSWYSPYSTIVYYKNPRAYYGNTSKTNLTGYRNGLYNNTNKRSNFGSLLNKAFSNNNNNSYYNPNSNNPSRTFNPGTTPSSNVGGRSGGFNSSGRSAGSSRPSRGGH